MKASTEVDGSGAVCKLCTAALLVSRPAPEMAQTRVPLAMKLCCKYVLHFQRCLIHVARDTTADEIVLAFVSVLQRGAAAAFFEERPAVHPVLLATLQLLQLRPHRTLRLATARPSRLQPAHRLR